MEISICIFQGLIAVLRDRGIRAEVLLQEARLDLVWLERQTGTIDVATFAQAAGAAYRLTGDASLALQIGMNAPPHTLHITGEVLMHCPTIRAALAEINRYLPLILPLGSFRLEEHGERAHLVFDAPFSEPHFQRFVSELTLTFVVRIGRHFASRASAPIAVHVRHPAPSYAQAYRQAFGCPVEFGAERDQIVFARALLDEHQPFGDEVLCRLLKSRADDLLGEERAKTLLSERVKILLRRELDLSTVDLPTVAQRLDLPPRSLRRRLRAEGCSLTSLLDAVRRDLALESLVDLELPIKQVAERLGFSEVSAFHRAFRRWTGRTPTRYRLETGPVGSRLTA